MGMDAYLISAHGHKELRDGNIKNSTEIQWSIPNELCYWRKFYELHDFINTHICNNKYECGDYIIITKQDLKEIIKFCCFNRDYWGRFDTVPVLCEIYDHWDEMKDNGLKIFYECDW